MGLPPQSQLGWEISITLLHFLALSTTVVRVGHRLRTKLAWWDDYVVLIPLVCDFMFILLFWLQFKTDKISWLLPESNAFLFSWWFTSFLASSIIWFSRISLSLSIARLFLPGHLCRKCALGFAIILFLFYLAYLLIITLGCRGTPWWQLDETACIISKDSFVDFSSDIVLVAAPLYILWNISFPSTQRILILVLFSSSFLTLVASVSYCGLFFGASASGLDSRLLYLMMGQLQVSLSLLACNLLVIVMLIYNQVRRREPPQLAGQPPPIANQPTTSLETRNAHPIDIESRSFSTLTLTSISEHNSHHLNSTSQDMLSNVPTDLAVALSQKSETPKTTNTPLQTCF
ncbi:hypothetical protein GALMADRAFT_97249 [Galerina marginata CBS 339.88]|uniref:Rhodopsin domain-containing protein n=1 Tax=Galerina marginata (strain CBS 339.88) TaxID=685588 RepID=A0A067T999_GALM3|nr:hypothetical protein GALMADRAFT_97249 [Galerina marginata CBS 339.88]